MASYGTLIGTCSNRESYYTAKIFWKTVSQDIAANTSKIAIWSGIENDGSAYNWDGTCSNWYLQVNGAYLGNTNGTGGAHTTTFNSNSASGWTWPNGLTAGSTVFNSNKTESLLNVNYPWHVEVTIPHDPDGTKTVPISHTYSLPSGGAGPGNVSISGNIVLDAIPRASVINSFSFPNKLLASTANTFSLSLTRYSSSFTHDITLKYGTYTIGSWSSQGLPTSLTLLDTEVNTLLSYMSTVTSATLTLTVQTKSGTTNIGSLQSKTAICTIDDSVKPTTPTLSHAEAATFLASIGAYINTKSKIKFTYGSVTAAANGGAILSSYKLNYEGNSINISTSGGTYTTSEINWSSKTGSPTSSTISIVATDSRGRTSSASLGKLTALAYSPPIISTFTGVRQANATTIRVTRVASTDPLVVNGSQKNLIKQELYKRKTTESFGSAYYTNTSAQGITSINTYSDSLSNDIINSYEFKIVITDVTNTTTTQFVTVGASGVETVLALGTKSVGIGKFIELNEPYTLDVGGTTRISGNTTIGGTANISSNTTIGGTLASSGAITQAGTPVSLTTHTHDIFTLIETKTISTNQAFTTTHGTYQHRDFLTFSNYIPSANGTIMINLNVSGYYGVVANYNFARGKVYIRNYSTANSSSGIIETYSALLFPTGSGTYDPQIFATGSFFMNVNSGTTYRFKITSYGDNINGGISTGSKASLYFIPRI